MPLYNKEPKLSIKRIEKLLNIDDTIKKSRGYLKKLNRALSYKNRKYFYPFPTIQEGNDITFRFKFLQDWDNLNIEIRSIDPKISKKVAPIGDTIFSLFRENYSVLSKSFNMLKNEIKDGDSDHLVNYDPSKSEPYSKVWCASKVFDLSKSLFSNIDRKLSSVMEQSNSSEGKMMTSFGKNEDINTMKKHFKSLYPIIFDDVHTKQNIVNQIKECKDNHVFKSIFNDRMAQSREFISLTEVNMIFNQFINVEIDQAKKIQKVALSPIGKAMKNFILEDKIKN